MNNIGPMLTAGVALIAAVLTYVAGTRSAKTRYEALKVAIEIRGLLREDEQEDWDRVVRKHVAYEHSRSVVNVHTTAAGILMASSALIILAGYVGGYSRFNGTALREWLAGTLVLLSLGLLLAVVAYEGAWVVTKWRSVGWPWVLKQWSRGEPSVRH